MIYHIEKKLIKTENSLLKLSLSLLEQNVQTSVIPGHFETGHK